MTELARLHAEAEGRIEALRASDVTVEPPVGPTTPGVPIDLPPRALIMRWQAEIGRLLRWALVDLVAALSVEKGMQAQEAERLIKDRLTFPSDVRSDAELCEYWIDRRDLAAELAE